MRLCPWPPSARIRICLTYYEQRTIYAKLLPSLDLSDLCPICRSSSKSETKRLGSLSRFRANRLYRSLPLNDAARRRKCRSKACSSSCMCLPELWKSCAEPTMSKQSRLASLRSRVFYIVCAVLELCSPQYSRHSARKEPKKRWGRGKLACCAVCQLKTKPM